MAIATTQQADSRRSTEGEDSPHKPPKQKPPEELDLHKKLSPKMPRRASLKHETVAKHPPNSTTTTAKHLPESRNGGKASAKL